MSKGLGRIEKAIREAFRERRRWCEREGRSIEIRVEDIADIAYGTREPTVAQRVAIRRAMNSFARKFSGCYLDGGSGRSPLRIVTNATIDTRLPQLRARKHPLAKAERDPSRALAQWIARLGELCADLRNE